MSSRRQMLEFLSLYQLPKAYQRVEYIESTGTQCIDTGVVGTNLITSKSVFELTTLTSNNFVLSCVYDTTNRCFQCSTSGTGYFRIGYGTELQASNEIVAINTKYIFENKIENNQYKTYLNGVNIISINTQTFNNGLNLYLFCNNSNLSIQNYAFVKLYSCKIYDKGTLIRDFVPCYRKSDNVIGLYDIVNGVFYTNVGTGSSFTKGNDV